jgi:hypothetical protein
MKTPTLIESPSNGNMFPEFNGQPLSWSIGLYNTLNDEKAGYPKTRCVIRAMKYYRPMQLESERKELVRSCFDRLFGHNARKLLAILDEDAK